MIDYEYADLLMRDSTKKQLVIRAVDGSITITNTELHQEQFELTESLCSEEELRFGACESTEVKFRVSNIFTSLIGKKIIVELYPEDKADNPLKIGVFTVQSDKPTADRKYRDVVAYDALYGIINSDCAAWYDSVLPNAESVVTLKQFRDSFFAYFGIEQEQTVLVNDGMTIKRTIQTTQLSGQEVLRTICELNGAFGHIGRDGKFQYVVLKEMVEGLYPANDLYPQDSIYPKAESVTELKTSHYISAKYENYLTEKIDKVQIRQEENDIGAIVGTGTNAYVVQGNFLVYGKSADELDVIASNLFDVIRTVQYRPAVVSAKGNPAREVGDAIRLWTKYEVVYTYILSRTLKGIQALKDEYASKGTQYRSQNVDSVRSSINQLRGKTNVLERTVDETKSTITDVESGLQSQIRQTADAITTEVTRATQAEGTLSSQITQTASAISLKVNKGQLSSEISAEAGQITLSSNRLVVDSTNFQLTADGTVTANNGVFKGNLRAPYYVNGVLLQEAYMQSGVVTVKGQGYTSSMSLGQLTLSNGTHTLAMTEEGINQANYIMGNYISASAGLSGPLNSVNIVPTLTADQNISINGSVNIATGLWVRTNFVRIESSDFRLKKDMRRVTENDLAILDKLKHYRFRYKDSAEDDLPHYGVLAQEVLSAMEELGIDIADQSIVEEYDSRPYTDEGMYTGAKAYRVNYMELLKLLLPAYSNMKEEMQEMKNELSRIKEAIGID